MSLGEIAAHVEQVRGRIATARQDAERLGQVRIEQQIGRALGVVVVDAWGELLEVRLDRTGLRTADIRTVDREILHAIHAAEARAGEAIDEHVRRWHEEDRHEEDRQEEDRQEEGL